MRKTRKYLRKGNVKAWFEVYRFRSMSTIFVSHQLVQVLFFLLLLLKDKNFANETRREARVHEVTRLISVVPHWYACIRLFFTFFFVFFVF